MAYLVCTPLSIQEKKAFAHISTCALEAAAKYLKRQNSTFWKNAQFTL